MWHWNRFIILIIIAIIAIIAAHALLLIPIVGIYVSPVIITLTGLALVILTFKWVWTRE